MPVSLVRAPALRPPLLLAALLAAACSDAATGGDDDDTGGGPDGGQLSTSDAAPADNCAEGSFDPQPEVDDGLDNDCDGLADEDVVCATGEADFATIGEAIAAAPAGGAIEVCPGTYREHLVIDGKALSLKGVGGADVTIVDAGGDGRGLDVSGTGDGVVSFVGFTIVGGTTQASPGAGARCTGSALVLADGAITGARADNAPGGGFYADGCALAIDGMRFEDNSAGRGGGGALVADSTGEIRGSRFLRNTASSSGGLAVVGGPVAVIDNEIRGNLAYVSGGGLHIESASLVEGNLILENEAMWIGGGIYVFENAPIFRGNTIGGNVSENDGGGIYSHVSDIVFEDNLVTGNSTGDDGGGVRIFSEVEPGAGLGPIHCRVEGNTIEGNVAADCGGGVRVSHEPCLLIDNVVRDNEAIRGGGMDLDNDASIVRGGLIENNRASGVGGGIASGLIPWNDGAFEDVTFRGNQADAGGGLFVDYEFRPLALTRLVFDGNRASRGAGVYLTGSDVTLTNSTFVGNQASAAGGAIDVAGADPYTDTEVCCPPASPTVRIAFVTAAGNTASSGAGLHLEIGGVTVENSIFANNGVAAGVAPAWSWNDVFPASFSGMGDPAGSNGNLSVDPKLVDAAHGDVSLMSNSPAKDAADPAVHDGDGSRADMGRFGGPAASP